MATTNELRPPNRPARAGHPGLRVLLAGVAVLAIGAGLLLTGAGREQVSAPSFLRTALGPAAEVDRFAPTAGVDVELGRSGYVVHAAAGRLELGSANAEGGDWRRFRSGAVRETGFGRETVVVDARRVEQFLTVEQRQGARTWRWRLGTGKLKPQLRVDGSVSVAAGADSAGFRVFPAAVLDGAGRRVTPAGTQWGLDRSGGDWFLTLALDDAKLPLPYTIDPAADYGPQTLYPTRTQSGILGGGTTAATPGPVYQLSKNAPSAICTAATTNTNTCPVVRENTSNLGTFYSRFWTTSAVAPATGEYLAAPQVPATGSATVGGYLVDAAGTAAPTAIPAGSWTFEVWTKASVANTTTVALNLTVGAWIVTTTGSGATANIASVDATVIDPTSAGATLPGNAASPDNLGGTTTTTKRTLTVPSIAKQTLTAGQRLYIRFYLKKVTTASARLNGYVHLLVNGTSAAVTTPSSILHPTAVETPGVPTSPVPTNNGWVKTTNPTFSAAYATTGTETGRLNVQLCPDAGCGAPTETLNSTSTTLGNAATGTTPVSTTTLVNGTYYRWRAAGEVVTASNPVGATGVAGSYTAEQRFGVDTTAPVAPSLSISEATTNSHSSGTAFYYRPAGAGGTFTVTATTSDGFSGVKHVTFPGLAGGFTPTGAANDTTPAPYSQTYTWPASTGTESGSKNVTAEDNATNVSMASPFTVAADSVGPTGGALTVNTVAATGVGTQSYDGDGTFAIGTRNDYNGDATSGFLSSVLTREDGTLSADACSAYGAPATLIGLPAQAGLATGCYRYVLTGTDNVGNTSTVTTVVKVDTSVPAVPSLTLNDSSADVHTTATTAYYRPAGSGSFDVTASSTDAHSGIASYSFPTLAGFTTSGAGASRTYTLNTPTEGNGAKTVTAMNNAGLGSNSTFTLTADSAVPTGGSVTANGGSAYDGDGTVALVKVDFGDSGAGIGSQTLTRASATLTADSCGSFSGSNAVTITGGNDADTLTTGCYRYTLTATDNVGNQTSVQSTIVKVDTSAPAAPTLGLSNLSANAHYAAGTLYLRPAAGGTFRVTAASSDAHTSVASYAFGSLNTNGGSNFGGSQSGDHFDYTFDGTTTAPGTARTVTASNPAGVVSGPGSYGIVADTAGPITSLTDPGQNLRGTVGLTATASDADAGVTSVAFQRSPAGLNTWTTISTDSTPGDGFTSSFDTTVPADGIYDLRALAADNVGNTQTSVVASRRVDNTNPTGSVSFPAAAANIRGTVTLTSDSADAAGSGVATVQFQRSPVGLGTWTNQAAGWDTTQQADGQYDLRVVTTDQAGNSFTSAAITIRVDNATPAATMNDPGANLAGTVGLTSSTSDGGSGIASVTYQRSPANAGTWTNQVAAWDTTTVTDGLYDLRVIAVDNAGNSTTSALVEDRRVDNTAPAVDVTAPVTVVNTAAADPFTITASSADGTLTQVEFFECPTPACGTQSSIGVDTTAPYSVSRAVPADGSWTLKAVATDAALNAGSDVQTVTVDRTRPQTTTDAGPPAITNQTGATFTFSSDEVGATFECRLDGGGWVACPTPQSYSGLADGAHTFDARATDPAGNVDLSPASSAWTVDTVAPGTSITGNPLDPTNATGASFSFTSTQGGSTFECRLDGGSWTACSTPQAYGSLAEGSHTFQVRATDTAGNTDGSAASFTWSIDVTAPTGSVTSPLTGARVRGTILLGSDSADVGSGLASVVFQRSPAGAGTWTPTAATWDTTLVTDGDYDLRVDTADLAGNVTSSAAITVTVDNTPPNTNIASQPADPTNATGATFTFASEPGATFECRLDGGAWGACAGPKSYSGLADGSHTFEVRATDAAGNVDPTPAAFTWTVDTAAPNTSITTKPADPTNATGASFTFTSTQGGSTFECRLDGGAWGACAGPRSYSGLADGSHTFEVRATDPAGNQDASAASYTWVVDTAAPDTSFSLTPSDPSSNTAPTFGFASTESPATYEVNLDGGGWVVASTPLTISPALADGSHTLQVRASDSAGNPDGSPAGHTWVIDATVPTGSLTAPADAAAVSGSAVTVSSNSADAVSGVLNARFERAVAGSGSWTAIGAADTAAPYVVAWDTTALADGDYDLRVTTRDVAGNEFVSPTGTVTIDNTAPTLSVVLPNPLNLATPDPASITATATDAGTGVASVNFEQCSETSAACTSDTWTPLGLDTTAPYGVSWPIPSDGARLIRTRATDGAGRQTTELVLTTVDRTRPAGTLTAPAAAANLRGASVSLAASASDTAPGTVNTVTFQRSPAGAGSWSDIATDSAAPYAATLDTTGLADGLYDLRVFTTDAAGNAEATPATIQVRVDNTNPTGSITAPAAAANIRGTVALTSNSADAGSGVATAQFQRSPAGAGTWTNQGASWDTTLVADGQYDLRVTTTDNAGNTFTSAAITVRVDNTNPTGSLTAPADAAEIGVAPVTLSSNSADPGSGVDTVVFERRAAGSGGAWTATPASWNTATGADAVADGSYELRVTTTDRAGNSLSSGFVTVLVDHSAPVTSASLAPGSPSNAPVTVSFSAGDGSGSGVSTTSHSVDGGSLQQGAAVVIGAPGDHSNDGSHVVQFFSTDEVGNVEAPKTVTVVIDTTAPGGTAGDPGDYLRGIASLGYSTAANDVSSVQFQFSPTAAGAWSNIGGADIAPPYETSWNTGLVADGQYDLRAVVTDSTGNVSNVLLPGLPKTVDNAAPTGSVTAPASAAFVSGSVDVTASATDGAAPPASGVSAVRFEVKPAGAGAFTVFGTQTVPVAGSTYRQALATGSLADGAADVRVVITDVAGNETTSAPRTINLDNAAPVVTLNDPGAAVSGTVSLGVGTSADTALVVFERSNAGAGSWVAIGTDATPGDGFTADLAAGALADGLYDLRARATDVGGNSTTSATRTTRIDNAAPTGSITSPANSDLVGGPAVALAATAADAGGSGIASVAFEVKVFGSGVFTPIAVATTAPYAVTWNATMAPDGAAILHAIVTDAAGNTAQTPAVPVTVDSTGPSVSLADPGAVVSGAIGLGASTGGGAVRVSFGVSPAGVGAWTEIGSDTSAPYAASLDTSTVADGLYDVRAVGYDSLGNPSIPSVRANVRFDNTAPQLLSSAPADGSISTSANEIVLTASEPVTAPVALLDGAPAPAPTASGSTLTFATGALSDGLHVLSGELEDPSGTRVPFRLAVTIESAPSADPPPVERSITSSGNWTMTIPGGLVTVKMPQSAWPTPPTPQDYILVLRVDAGSSTAAGPGFAPGTQIVEVTARWAIAGTYVTEFREPLEIVFSNPSGGPVIPVWSRDGISSWNTMGALEGQTLSAARPDGFYRDSAGVHVLTRHLTFFGLLRDSEAPTAPRDLAGVVAGDGLTVRWIPGTDASGQLGNTVLFVNDEPYRNFGPTEYEAKLGAFSSNDTRTFTLVQLDAAGNVSPRTQPLRAVPQVAGRSLESASGALAAAGFEVGAVREQTTALVAPGTVIAPTGVRLALESAAIDLVVARSPGVSAQTKLAFSVAGSKKLALQKQTTIGVRVKVSRPANVSATLFGSNKQRLYSWRLQVKAGATVVKLRVPSQIRRPGTYTIALVARSGSETVRRTISVILVGPKLAQVKPRAQEIEVVLTGAQPGKGAGALQPGLAERGMRVVAHANPDETFALAGSAARNVGIVVVDVDAYGLGFVGDLRTVFPALRLIAIAREPATRGRAVHAGAVLALPRSTSSRQLANAIVRVAGR